MKTGKCKFCSKIKLLQKHHYVPQRIKKTNDFVYICEECHERVHPENDIIIKIKRMTAYHNKLKKFLKTKHPKVWDEWKPEATEIKKELKEKYEKKVKVKICAD